MEVNPRVIAIATTTLYPKWYPGKDRKNNSVDKLRGDLAIQTIGWARQAKYQVVVVDGGSSEAFKVKLSQMEVSPQPERERGMSGSRRQAFKEAAGLEGVKAICWLEPEKVSFIRNYLPHAVRPILNDEADIVVPGRTPQSFKTYPDYQAVQEQRVNRWWNRTLRTRNLLPAESDDLDVCFGPRIFKNDPEILELFLKRYKFIKRGRRLDEIVNPELWPNATFFPVVEALFKGYRVRGIPVNYIHPARQTSMEAGNLKFDKKRVDVATNIAICTIHHILFLEKDPRSRLRQVN